MLATVPLRGMLPLRASEAFCLRLLVDLEVLALLAGKGLVAAPCMDEEGEEEEEEDNADDEGDADDEEELCLELRAARTRMAWSRSLPCVRSTDLRPEEDARRDKEDDADKRPKVP